MICPQTSRYVAEHVQGLYQQRAGPPSVFTVGFQSSCSLWALPSPACWKSNHTDKAHLSFSDLNISSCWIHRPWSSLISPSSLLCIPTSLRAHLVHCSSVSGVTLSPFTPWVLQKSSHVNSHVNENPLCVSQQPPPAPLPSHSSDGKGMPEKGPELTWFV